MSFLSELIKYQSASVTIRPASDGLNEYLGGELQIIVKGDSHTFVAEGQTIEAVISGLEHEYLRYGWTSEVPIVEVHSGTAEVVTGTVIIVDFDNLASDRCPRCNGDLEFPWDMDDRKCPSCLYMWTKEDE